MLLLSYKLQSAFCLTQNLLPELAEILVGTHNEFVLGMEEIKLVNIKALFLSLD